MSAEIKWNKNKYRILLAITGVIAIILGVWAMMAPYKTIVAITWVFGILMIIAGAGSIVIWNDLKGTLDRTAGLLISGLISIVLGGILLFTHVTSFIMLSTLFAVWFIIDSVTSCSFAELSRSPMLSYIFGFIGIVLGVILLFSPTLSLTALVFMIGFTLITYGIMAIIKAF